MSRQPMGQAMERHVEDRDTVRQEDQSTAGESPRPPNEERPEAGATVAGSASGTEVLPDEVRDVVEAEGAAQDTGTPSGATSLYLFHLDEPVREVGLDDLPGLVHSDENFVWVDLSGFGERDLRRVADVLSLNRVSVHSALSPWQRPRLDVHDQVFFVTATAPRIDEQQLRVYAAELDLFVGDSFLVSAHKHTLPFHDAVMARAAQNPGLMQQDSSYLLYIILDELLEYYEQLAERMNDQIEQMEERALADTSDAFLGDLQRLKRYVYALLKIAEQHRGMLSAFTRPDFPFTSREEMEPYFRDLEDRLAHLLDVLDTARSDVTGAFDIYVSHVSHRMNQVMQVLTIVSVTLLPTTVILGFWGTNFPGLPLYTPLAFAVMVAAIVISTFLALFAFRRKRWI